MALIDRRDVVHAIYKAIEQRPDLESGLLYAGLQINTVPNFDEGEIRRKVIQEIRELIQKSYLIQCPDEGAEWLDEQLDKMEENIND